MTQMRSDSSRRDLLRLRGARWRRRLPALRSRRSNPPARRIAGMQFENKETVRLGLIGVGGRGNSLVGQLLRRAAECRSPPCATPSRTRCSARRPSWSGPARRRIARPLSLAATTRSKSW